jgi:Ca2+-binding EF-hand superfamily protein
MKTWLLLALLSLSTCSATFADEKPADLELLLLGGNSPLRLKLEVEISGRPWKQVWDEHFAALVAYCDRDANGLLDKQEARRLPSVQALREVLSLGFLAPLGEAPDWQQVDADRDGKLTAKEVAAFYRCEGLAAPLVGAGVMPFSADLTGSLVRLLDADGNEDVSEAELRQAPELLSRLDRNDDELIGAGELVSRVLYPGASGSVLLRPWRPDPALPASLAQFPAFVLPQDGKNRVDAEMVVQRLAGKKAAPATDVVCHWKSTAAVGARLSLVQSPTAKQATFADLSVISQPGIQIFLRDDEGRLSEAIERVTSHYAFEFTESDGDSDGVLTAEERGEESKADWSWLLNSADRNADERLARDELEAWLALQGKLAAAQALVTVLDAGRGLFELLDANHDGGLSRRELHDAADRVREVGALEDGKLVIARLPRQLLITVSHGYPRSALGRPPRRGPAWFLAMDRNADGFVSRREFSGPREAFLKLDRDADGIIAPAEATAE